MAKNYAALARSVIAALGGVDNISAVTHCMTRLRFVIKDDALIDSPTLKTIPGVLGVVRSDNQCQVIIGNTVSQAFQEVVSLLPGDMQPAQPVGKPKLTLRRIGAGDPRCADRHHVTADPGDYRRIDGQTAGDDPRDERRADKRIADLNHSECDW